METMRDGGDHWDDGGHEGLYGPWRMIDGGIGMMEAMRDGGDDWDGGDHWDDGDHKGWWRP